MNWYWPTAAYSSFALVYGPSWAWVSDTGATGSGVDVGGVMMYSAGYHMFQAMGETFGTVPVCGCRHFRKILRANWKGPTLFV